MEASEGRKTRRRRARVRVYSQRNTVPPVCGAMREWGRFFWWGLSKSQIEMSTEKRVLEKGMFIIVSTVAI